jgi:hypothetical protein
MNVPIYLRVHARTDQSLRSGALAKLPQERFAPHALMVDTETRLNLRQNLMLGFYRFCEFQNGLYVCLEEGIFYADDLDESQITTLREFLRSHGAETIDGCSKRLRLYSRSQFVEKVFFPACSAGAIVCAYNLPFDLSRLAAEYRVARRAGGRGWSFVLSEYEDPKTGKTLPNSFRPRIQLRSKDSKAAFIRLAGGDAHRPFRSGRFLDLKAFVWALRNKNLSLESACREFNVAGKLDHAPSGRVTKSEIEYCRQDARASVNLLNALLAEFRQYPLGE